MAALDEQMLQARLELSRPKRRSITAQRSSGAGLRGAAISQLTGPGAQASPDVEPAKSSESRRLVAQRARVGASIFLIPPVTMTLSLALFNRLETTPSSR
jgi:hypothetical protein